MNIVRSIIATLCLSLLSALPATAADEVAFWELWKTHLAATNGHAEAVAACDAFEQKHPGDPFIIVARQFKAWHLLKLDRNADASALLTPMVTPGSTGLDKGASELARAWLTRLDRETVKAALQKVYARDVAYPEALDVWPKNAAGTPPSVDRWGKAWKYRLTGFTRIPGLRNQKYELQALLLGDTSDLAAALALPYAEQLTLKPVGLRPMTSGPPMIVFETGETGAKATMTAGTRSEGTFLAYVGDRIILVADYTHWKVLPKPRR